MVFILALVAACLSLPAREARAATFTVATTQDSGAGSLRQAIHDANANAGADTIVFAFLGPTVRTISLDSALPTITDTVSIDGWEDETAAPPRPPGRR